MDKLSTDDYEYAFYAVNRKGKYVMGFEDREEACNYCSSNRLHLRTFQSAAEAKFKPWYLSSWTRDFPTEPVLGPIFQ